MRQSDIQRYYDLHGKELQNYLNQQVNCAQTAADLTQEIFVKLLKGKSIDPIENPRAYLYKIASNLLIDHFRKKAPTIGALDVDVINIVADDTPGPERRLIAQKKVEHLHSIIRELPPRQKDILMMHKFEELSYKEIAKRLEISENTVMVHMMRALNTCREKLKDK